MHSVSRRSAGNTVSTCIQPGVSPTHTYVCMYLCMNYIHIYTYLCDITDISDFRRLFGGHMHAYAVNAYAVSIKLGNHITLQSPFSHRGVSVAVRNALRSRRPISSLMAISTDWLLPHRHCSSYSIYPAAPQPPRIDILYTYLKLYEMSPVHFNIIPSQTDHCCLFLGQSNLYFTHFYNHIILE
jgi:hypothetical protein